jgi:hypothetical protein
MSIYCTGNKRLPFVDGKCYDKLCFACYHVPKTLKQIYDKDGCVEEEIPLPYCHKHLHTAQELYDSGSTDSKAEAMKSIKAVRQAIKSAKLPRKPKPLKQPSDPGVELNEEE